MKDPSGLPLDEYRKRMRRRYIDPENNWVRAASSRDNGWDYDQELAFAIDFVWNKTFMNLELYEQNVGRKHIAEGILERLRQKGDS